MAALLDGLDCSLDGSNVTSVMASFQNCRMSQLTRIGIPGAKSSPGNCPQYITMEGLLTDVSWTLKLSSKESVSQVIALAFYTFMNWQKLGEAFCKVSRDDWKVQF